MAFTDLTGRHAISVIGTAPMQSAVGGPSGGYTNFDGSGCLVVSDPGHDFVYGTGPVCIELIAYVYASTDLYDPLSDAGMIIDCGSPYGSQYLSISGYRNHYSVYPGPAPWRLLEEGWRNIRYDIADGVCRAYVDGVLITTGAAYNVTAIRNDEMRIAGRIESSSYTTCKLAALRITRASRIGQPFDLTVTGSADPLWAQTVLQINLDPALGVPIEDADSGMYPDDLLSRAVVSSLFSWRRARDDDSIPAESRQGWWGDTFAPVSGDEWGSRLWLLTRENLTPDTLARAREYSLEALQWLIDDGVAARVEVDTEAVSQNAMGIAARIYRADGSPPVDIRFDDVWRFINA